MKDKSTKREVKLEHLLWAKGKEIEDLKYKYALLLNSFRGVMQKNLDLLEQLEDKEIVVNMHKRFLDRQKAKQNV